MTTAIGLGTESQLVVVGGIFISLEIAVSGSVPKMEPGKGSAAHRDKMPKRAVGCMRWEPRHWVTGARRQKGPNPREHLPPPQSNDDPPLRLRTVAGKL